MKSGDFAPEPPFFFFGVLSSGRSLQTTFPRSSRRNPSSNTMSGANLLIGVSLADLGSVAASSRLGLNSGSALGFTLKTSEKRSSRSTTSMESSIPHVRAFFSLIADLISARDFAQAELAGSGCGLVDLKGRSALTTSVCATPQSCLKLDFLGFRYCEGVGM